MVQVVFDASGFGKRFAKPDDTTTVSSRLVAAIAPIQGLSRRILRFNANSETGNAIRLAFYSFLGFLLMAAGQVSARASANRVRLAAMKLQVEEKRQQVASKANAEVAAFLAAAQKSLITNNLREAESHLELARRVPNVTQWNEFHVVAKRIANAKAANLTAEAVQALRGGEVNTAKQKIN